MGDVVDTSVPTLSVVVPTSRGGEDLCACVDSLTEQSYPGLEIVVVDNGCSPALGDLRTGQSKLTLVRNEENVGYAVATNQGIEVASGTLVLLLNDDTIVEPGALQSLVDALVVRPKWGACQAKLVRADDPKRLDTAGSFFTSTGFLVHRGSNEPADEFEVSDEIFAAKGAALLLRRDVLERVGGFDADFFAYLEDSDLCWRVWLAGWEVGFAADARIVHRERSTASRLPPAFVQFHSFKNRICTLLKNLGAARLVWILPFHLVLCLGLAGWFTLNGRSDIAGAILRAIVWNVQQAPSTARKRAVIQRSRQVPDRELIPKISQRVPLRRLFGYAKWTAERDQA